MHLIKNLNPTALADLDNLSDLYGKYIVHDIIMVVGVLIGLKPVAMIGNNSENRDIDAELISDLGLRTAFWSEKNLTYVSFDQILANRMAELHRTVWGENTEHLEENREIGQLLGYPKTAVEYFVRRLELFKTGMPLPMLDVEDDENISEYFLEMILSPEHYKAEIAEYCRPLEKAVQQYAPKTYALICALSSRS